jgi:outer membrane protein assembly factor BamB
VTTANEAALRAALNKGGTVTLACDGTILLANTLLITKDVVLDGTGRNVTLDGGGAVRVLLVQTNIRFTLRNVTVTRGRADQGGGLLNNGGSVVLLDSVFHSNQAVGNDTNNLAAVGGAIYSIAGEVAATNTLFATNTAVRGHAGVGPLVAEARGGAIAIQDGVLKLAECQFTTNQAAGGIFLGLMEAKKGAAFGGAVCLQNSEGYVRGCRFDNNLAHSPEPPWGPSLRDLGANVQGGAIHQEGARLLKLQDCVFVGNLALGGGGPRNGSNGDGRGGAVSAYGNLVADHCSFESNACDGGSGGAFSGGHAFGGALYTTNTATLNHCLFSANWARAGSGCYCGWGGWNGDASGGAVYAQGTLQILNSTFAFNWVGAWDIEAGFPSPSPGSCAGGALFSTAVCVATNSTWFQNRAAAQRKSGGFDGPEEGAVAGAAIYQSDNPLAFVHCTIASNAIVSLPTNTSAGIVIGTNAVARLFACILSGNTNANLAGRIMDEGFNLSSDHSVFFAAASSRNDVNPKLGAFGNHGGPTPTLALLRDSPAIDAVASGACPETDQRGVPRPSGARCDIGAFEFVPTTPAAPEVVAWGNNDKGQTTVPSGLSNVVAIAAGMEFSLALTAEGRVVAWGANPNDWTTVPSQLNNVVAIAAGSLHSLALTADGRVVGWGYNLYGQATAPSGLSNVAGIAAGEYHSLALTTEGRVVSWGIGVSKDPDYGQATVPSGLSNVVGIAAGNYHSLALTAEGEVVAWGAGGPGTSGYPHYGQATVPSGLSNVVAIAAESDHSLALTAEGRVVAWGNNDSGQATVPNGLNNVVAIAAGFFHNLALMTEGRVVGWGWNFFGQTTVPSGLSNVVAIAAGYNHSLALIGLPTGVAAPAWVGPRFLVATVNRPYYYRIMVRNGATAYGATGLPPGLVLNPGTGLITGQPAQAGTYSVVFSATNSVGSSAWTVTLFVNGQGNGSLPTITSQPQSHTNVAGASITFNVAAMGSAPLSYQWRFSGLPLAGQTGTNLTLSNVQSTNAGNYDVVVANAFGSVTSAVATLTVAATAEYTFLTLAGLAANPGSADGTGSAARFNAPFSVAVDSAGNLYVADLGNHTIRKVTPAGVVTTLAGLAGRQGSADGMGSAARFACPSGVAVDSAGNVYVADRDNHTIRKVTAAGVVTTLAGLAGSSGTADGTGSAARFYLPSGVAVDSAGNVYVGDTPNCTIRKVTPAGAVTTLAGLAGTGSNSGSTDGQGSAARFYEPRGVAVDSAGNVYVADSRNDTIRKVTPTGVVTTLAGLAGSLGSADGTGGAARFSRPFGVAVDSAGNVYVADTDNATIRKVTPTGVVTTLAGLAGSGGSADGTGSAARFGGPTGVALDNTGNIYVADSSCATIRIGFRAGVKPVAITSQPQSQSVLVGATVAFEVSASGTPPLSYQWLKDGTNLLGADAPSLTLTNVQMADAGRYLVVISNTVSAVMSQPAILTVDAAQPGQKLWDFQTGGQVVSCPAIGVDGTVYVGSDGGTVYALNGATGQTRWQFATGGHVRSSPAIGTDGTMYVGSWDYNVYALSGATGQKQWEFQTAFFGTAYLPWVDASSAIGADGTVYVGSYDGKVYALSGATGQKQWEFQTGDFVDSSPAIGADGMVYVGSGDHKVYALNGATGQKQWEFQTGDKVYSSPAIGADGTVYVGSSDGRVYALNGATGQKQWEFQTGDRVISSPAIGADGTVYMGSWDYKVYALSGTTGQKRWEFQTGGQVWSSPAIGADGTVYVGSQDFKVYALSGATGQKRWEFGTGGAVWSPAIGTDGTVYVGSGDGRVYALCSSSVGGLAQSPWPKFRGDGQNTGRRREVLATSVMITSQPQSQSVLAGATVTFEVAASGTPPLSYQWQKDGTNLFGPNAPSLTLTNVQMADAGRYLVVISNAFSGTMSQPAILTVTSPIHYVANTVIVSSLAGSGVPGYADGNGASAQFYYPNGGYVDPQGNIYIADGYNNRIRKITREGTVSTLAGTGVPGYVDGQADQAMFNQPLGVGVDSQGNVFVADTGNNRIRQISAAGVVSTVAGSGLSGYVDGPGTTAWFSFPNDLAVDDQGNLYVSEFSNHTVRKITPEGIVSTWAGNGTAGYVDGPRAEARFNQPGGIARDGAGNLYVTEWSGQRVRKISGGGQVSTVAGSGVAGYVDGPGATAQFRNPDGIVVDAVGNLFITDNGNQVIRRISPAGMVETVAGTGTAGYVEGTGTVAQFSNPAGIGMDGEGNLYVADGGNQRVRKLTLLEPVMITSQPQSQSVLAGATVTFEVSASGTPPLTYEWQKNGINLFGANAPSLTLTNVQMADAGSYIAIISNAFYGVMSQPAILTVTSPIHYVTNTVMVSSLAGSGVPGYADGNGASAQFYYPNGGYVDPQGNVYIADAYNHRIRRVSAAGVVSTVAGTGQAGYADGPATNCQFSLPLGICVDGAGNVFVADTGNNRIRKISADGQVSTVAGSGMGGYADGRGTNAWLNFPNDLVVDPAGDLFVTEFDNHTVRKIAPDGTVSTWVGNGSPGYVDGPRPSARLNQPGGIALDQNGNLYVTEWGGQRIRKISAEGQVSTVAGDGTAGYLDGAGSSARFRNPDGIVVDGVGNLFIADNGNHAIRRISPSGWVETVAGTGLAGFADGNGPGAQFTNPSGIGLDGEGNLYVADGGNHRVRMLTLLEPVTNQLTARMIRDDMALAWGEGVLQAATDVEGPWRDVLEAKSPWLILIPPTEGRQFFRVRY